MSCCIAKLLTTHLKKINPLLQSCLAFLEQYAHLALLEKPLDFACVLLGLNKGMDFMEGSKSQVISK
jgi:hypothetical protein